MIALSAWTALGIGLIVGFIIGVAGTLWLWHEIEKAPKDGGREEDGE